MIPQKRQELTPLPLEQRTIDNRAFEKLLGEGAYNVEEGFRSKIHRISKS